MFLRGVHEKRFAQDGIGWIDPVKSEKLGKTLCDHPARTSRSTFQDLGKDDELGNNRRLDQEAVELWLTPFQAAPSSRTYDRAPLAQERRLIIRPGRLLSSRSVPTDNFYCPEGENLKNHKNLITVKARGIYRPGLYCNRISFFMTGKTIRQLHAQKINEDRGLWNPL